MPRQARKNIGTSFLHVILQGVNKEFIFNKEEYIQSYLEIFFKKAKDFDFELLAYCIMNNHAHFLVYCENILEFGKFMHLVNLIYAQMYNKQENRVGVVFRNRYKSEPIYDLKYLINCIKYIHNNPVKANMVNECAEYSYSSYSDYINNTGVSQNKIMKKLFGTNCDYQKMFASCYDKRFVDIDEESGAFVDDFIFEGINQFVNKTKFEVYRILSDRNVLKQLIKFLKDACQIKYVEIRNYFNMSKGIMDDLKKE